MGPTSTQRPARHVVAPAHVVLTSRSPFGSQSSPFDSFEHTPLSGVHVRSVRAATTGAESPASAVASSECEAFEQPNPAVVFARAHATNAKARKDGVMTSPGRDPCPE